MTVRFSLPLFLNGVCFHAHPVAWLIAETEEQARLAAAKVDVVYDALPALLSIEDALATDSFLTEPEIMRQLASPATPEAVLWAIAGLKQPLGRHERNAAE